MKEFANARFSLRRAPRPLRLIYAGFLLMVAVGLVTQITFQAGRIGVSPRAIARYYRGDETGEVMAFPKTFGQLLEITHAHAFVMGVVFLILAHLFAGAEISDAFKAVVLALTFAGLLGDLAAPWLTRYVAAGGAWIGLGSWIAEDVGIAVLVAVSAGECLRRSTIT